jgi:hypothetical protein
VRKLVGVAYMPIERGVGELGVSVNNQRFSMEAGR